MEEVKNKRKSERGSVTLFVLVTMLFFITILISSYTRQASKISSQRKQIEEIQKEYSAEGKIEEVYFEIENTMPVSIILYKPSGEIYDINEWTNEDLTLEIFYPGGIEDSYKYYYIDGVRTKYTKGQKISQNCTIKVEYEGHREEVKVSKIDKELPTVSLSPNGGTYVMPTSGNATIKTTINAQDSMSGIKSVEYAWGESSSQEPSNYIKIENGEEVEKTDCTQGDYYLWIMAIDNVGNEKKEVSRDFSVLSREESDNELILTANPSANIWTNEEVVVTAKYGANLTKNKTITSTGTANVDYTVNGTTSVTVKTNNQTVTATAEDIAGNKIIKTYQVTNIDKELPTVSLSPNGGDKYTMPTSGNATIKTTLTAEDAGGSELNTLEYAWSTSDTEEPTIWTTFTNGSTVSKTDCREGNYYLWTKVTDKAGNRATSIKVSNAFTISANTEIANQITLTPSTTEWTNRDVIVTVSYGENLTQNRKAGVGSTVDNARSEANTSTATSVTVSTNNYYVYAEATDIAGNKITKNYQITNIDKELPTVELSQNGGTYTIAEGNTTVDIRTQITATDTGGSGLNILQYQL